MQVKLEPFEFFLPLNCRVMILPTLGDRLPALLARFGPMLVASAQRSEPLGALVNSTSRTSRPPA